jgi:RNA polymerase sigma-70 factor (ECF subfamily)
MCSDAVQDSPPTTAWCEALYEAQATPLVLYGRALGLSHGEAEDVLQDVFRELLKRDDRPHRPEHYLVRAFRNRALNYRRSLWRRVAREFESGRWFERAPDESPRERAAMRCLATLPPEQREVIVLKLWHGHTFEEIAALLELSPNTAAGRYRYGLQKLRACLREPLPETEHELAGSFGDPDFNLDTPPPVPGA